MRLGAEVARSFALPDHSAEQAFAHFRGNEALLRELLGHDRVAVLRPDVYRVLLNPKGAMGLMLRPSFDVAFEAEAPGRILMRCLDARLDESTHPISGFEAGFAGEAQFSPLDEGGAWVSCHAHMHVGFDLPPPFAWMPQGPLEALGEGVLRAAMGALAGRLPRILAASLARAEALPQGH